MNQIASPLVQLSEGLEELVKTVSTRVVAVHGRDRLTSSGLIIQRGVVVTAEETVERDDDLRIGLPDGQSVPATLAGRDPSTDVAVLRYEAAEGPDPLPVAPAAGAGAMVVAVGRAMSVSAGLGILASVGEAWRSSLGGMIDARIRVDLALSRSAEGGALVDVQGRLVGMPVFGPWRRVIAIPASTILRTAERILSHGSVSRGYVGIGVQPVDIDDGRASIITSVDPGGPAGKAGFLLGDIVTRWNGEALRGPRALVDHLGPESVGTEVELGIQRAGKPMKIKLAVSARPKA
jgi:S1-C subfamily serine protease